MADLQTQQIFATDNWRNRSTEDLLKMLFLQKGKKVDEAENSFKNKFHW